MTNLTTPFEDIDPQKYGEVINGLQKENNELKKKRSKGQINEAYAATIERQDIQRQKQLHTINKLKQKKDSLQDQITNLQNSRKELKDINTRLLVLAIKHCPIEHHDFDELKKISVNKELDDG